MKNQQFSISVFVAYLTIPWSTSTDMTPIFHTWSYDKVIEIQSNLRRKKLHRANQGSNLLGASFRNRDNVKFPIQFRIKGQPRHLER